MLTVIFSSNLRAPKEQAKACYNCKQGHGLIVLNMNLKTWSLDISKIGIDMMVESSNHGITI